MQFFRILGVWSVGLAIASVIFGGPDGWSYVTLMYGLFFTLPAPVVLSFLSVLEAKLVKRGDTISALALGPAAGVLIPILLFLRNPEANEALSGLGVTGLITLSTGIAWAISYLMVPRERPTPPSAG